MIPEAKEVQKVDPLLLRETQMIIYLQMHINLPLIGPEKVQYNCFFYAWIQLD